MKYFLSFGLLILHFAASAQVTPTKINSSQIKHVSKTLSGLFSSRTANDPKALGEDFELEVSAFYQDLGKSGLTKLDTEISDQFLDSIISLKKGLYWNIDLSVSTALPISSNLISGFSFNIEHTSKFGSFILKPDIYISHYNLNDILNIETVGISLISYKKFKFFHLGLGVNFESISSLYNKNFLSNQLSESEASKVEFIESSLISKISSRMGAIRFTATYVFREKENSILNFSIGKRF